MHTEKIVQGVNLDLLRKGRLESEALILYHANVILYQTDTCAIHLTI